MPYPDVDSRVATLEANHLSIVADVIEMKADVKEIRRTLAGRPSWAIAAMLTFLSSSTVGLGVALATSGLR